MNSRNALCPCGSGRRFKHCHGQLANEGSAGGADRLDFVVAGAQRSGTTVLDLYLRDHRGTAMPWTRKELHFFDNDENFAADTVDHGAYHANFGRRESGQLRGEATPSYMYWQPAAERMARYNRALKIIVVLRNPITRAYSHWNKERQRGREPLPFLEAVVAEPERVRASGKPQALLTSYTDRGFYSRQLRHLWQHFPADQTLVLSTTDLQADPQGTLGRVANFLGLEPFPRVEPKAANVRQYENPMHPREWKYLAGIYADEIRELEQLLGWDCSPWRQMPPPR